MTDRCEAEATGRWVRHQSTHTVQCQLDTGHDGLHEWRDDTGRSRFWGGPPKKAQPSTRFRFGRWLEAK